MFPAELVLKVVPQRYPFLMIDRIVEQNFREKAVCQKNITNGEEVLTGHFPGRPIYPGVLMIEMGLQTTQVMLTNLEAVLSGAAGESVEMGYIIQVERFKFMKTVTPGDSLRITSTFYKEVLGMMQAKIEIADQDGTPVAQGTVTVKAAG